MTGEKILIVDDVPANLAVLSSALEPEGYEILAASDGATAIKLAAKAQPQLILLDVMMPEMDGLETCRRLKTDPVTSELPIIFITARTESDSVVDAFQAGGVDYIIKPFQPPEVLSRVATHLRLHRLTRELRAKNQALEQRTTELAAEVERRRAAECAFAQADQTLVTLSNLEAERSGLNGLIGSSEAIRKVREDIRRLHQFPNTSVLITGESGTGKELIARAIHLGSSRAKQPFVPVNCVAIPAELAESILFGHVKGAFTGATADRKGCFELADGGTLFLDEIGDMPVSLQVKLLRVLEDGFVTPVGASTQKHVNVRVIAATNADLEGNIQSGAFRNDLYFRLARYSLATPALRECMEDVPLLVQHFLHLFATEMGLPLPTFTTGALQGLARYHFPGNVRELKNLVERALIESGGASIQSEHLHLLARIPHETSAPKATAASEEMVAELPLNLAEAEDLLIQRALRETDGNIADAARLLGIHRTRIYRKLAQNEPMAN